VGPIGLGPNEKKVIGGNGETQSQDTKLGEEVKNPVGDVEYRKI